MSLCYCQFLRSSCCYGLLLCLPSVFVVVVVLLSLLLLVLSSFLLEMSWGGASASAVLMLLWFAALFASVGAFAEHSREISFAQQAFICTPFALVLLVVVVVVVVSVKVRYGEMMTSELKTTKRMTTSIFSAKMEGKE